MPTNPAASMDDASRALAKSRIRRHEGSRAIPYQDTLGVWTAGIGRNLQANPFSPDEIELMFQNDFARAEKAASTFGCWAGLDDTRRGVLVEMAFQLGPFRLHGFRMFLNALQKGNWQTASAEMLDSKWARQTPARAEELARILRTGIV